MRAAQAVLLCAATVVMLGASEESRLDRLGHGMMCVCGCNQILVECNHVGCPDSARMIMELRNQISQGASDGAIQNWFVAKYGAIVLAAPSRGGFDDVAWIMPITVFVLATLGTAAVVWMWRRRWLRMAGAGGAIGYAPIDPGPAISPEEAALRERIRRETAWQERDEE
jgi:cytochrome c-type biogenesis protein CcmH